MTETAPGPSKLQGLAIIGGVLVVLWVLANFTSFDRGSYDPGYDDPTNCSRSTPQYC